jgi:hypothetical protein
VPKDLKPDDIFLSSVGDRADYSNHQPDAKRNIDTPAVDILDERFKLTEFIGHRHAVADEPTIIEPKEQP